MAQGDDDGIETFTVQNHSGQTFVYGGDPFQTTAEIFRDELCLKRFDRHYDTSRSVKSSLIS